MAVSGSGFRLRLTALIGIKFDKYLVDLSVEGLNR